LATENPRKYIQEESPASPPQVERFCKASPSLGVDMENGSRMRRTQKREKNHNRNNNIHSYYYYHSCRRSQDLVFLAIQAEEREKRNKKKRELDSSVTDPQRKRKCKLRMQV
jgi:hypothetical protein